MSEFALCSVANGFVSPDIASARPNRKRRSSGGMGDHGNTPSRIFPIFAWRHHGRGDNVFTESTLAKAVSLDPLFRPSGPMSKYKGFYVYKSNWSHSVVVLFPQ
jgi:hypothetical protein